MKERPIIFNAEMVKAILDGRKTQTRRIIKPQPTLSNTSGFNWKGAAYGLGFNDKETNRNFANTNACPLGKVGDRLWVRETWGVVSHAFDENGLMCKWAPDRPNTKINEMKFGHGYYTGHAIYRADGPFTWCGDDDGGGEERSAWKPSIHMPRRASRINLEITNVRVERLNDISQEDANAEGCCYGRGGGVPDFAITPADHFPTLWASIYGEESWSSNPWVWVIEFKRLEGGAA